MRETSLPSLAAVGSPADACASSDPLRFKSLPTSFHESALLTPASSNTSEATRFP
jgi:hypothetical protein